MSPADRGTALRPVRFTHVRKHRAIYGRVCIIIVAHVFCWVRALGLASGPGPYLLQAFISDMDGECLTHESNCCNGVAVNVQ